MDKPILVNLPEFLDNRGVLTFVEEEKHIPFKIHSVYSIKPENIRLNLPADSFIVTPGDKYGYLIPQNHEFDIKDSNSGIIVLSSAKINGIEALSAPFRVKRAYFITGIPPHQTRGSHAHRVTAQMIFAVKGSFSVTLDNGEASTTVMLAKDCNPVHIPDGIWHTLDNFSPDAVCLVLASELYSDDDYIRDYRDFIEFRKMAACDD
ncbi:MAG: FdtA/QdtA family cupin domain-containing protein [Paramuribaculum sp.]|nr:FdtA/QdtA family cupin domain-containing protein [Paramuribaculum sp.]